MQFPFHSKVKGTKSFLIFEISKISEAVVIDELSVLSFVCKFKEISSVSHL